MNPQQTLKSLHRLYPDLNNYLNVTTPLQILVATIMSAQVKDDMVNRVTPRLFNRYRTAKDFARADVQELVSMMPGITFTGNKARAIKETCRLLCEKHEGNVPNSKSELMELPGIGGKTAHAILQDAFNIVEGVIVDTHVLRMSYRLGWASTPKNAIKTENELVDIVPQGEWKNIPHLMKRHGRAICRAPSPVCSKCVINKSCPKEGVTQLK